MIKSRAAVPRGRRLRLLAAAMPPAALLATACGPDRRRQRRRTSPAAGRPAARLDRRVQLGHHLLHAAAAPSGLRHQAAPRPRDQRPRRDRGAA